MVVSAQVDITDVGGAITAMSLKFYLGIIKFQEYFEADYAESVSQ